MKAVALVSGGLDSILAVRLAKKLGIDLNVFNMKTPFCLCDKKSQEGCLNQSLKLAQELGLKFKNIFLSDEYFELLENPEHGFGSNMNPCIDCRILLFKKAKEFMQEIGASFIITGEVLGQRPMSQHKRAMQAIDAASGLKDLVVRPLSARVLPVTLPEKLGWISREKLLDFSGRTRKPQLQLAKSFGMKDFPCPAGGCLLTVPEFSKRLKDLMEFGRLSLNSIELLKTSRIFKLSDTARLFVGRNEGENGRLEKLLGKEDYTFRPKDIMGPFALGRGIFDQRLITASCRIVCRYCDLEGKEEASIIYNNAGADLEKILNIPPYKDNELADFLV